MKTIFSLSFIRLYSNENSGFFQLIFLIFSCTTDCDYPYRDNLDKFLATEVGYKIPDGDVILVMLPLDGCNTCLNSTIDMLINSKDAYDLIISATDNNQVNKYNLGRLNLPSERMHFDLKNNYNRYEIGVNAPLIFRFKNRKCEFYSETTENNHQRIKKYFGWH